MNGLVEMAIYKEKSSNETISTGLSWLWTLIFGFMYFMYHRCFGHAFILFFIQAGEFNNLHPTDLSYADAENAKPFFIFVHFIYALCASGIIGRAYTQRGWIKTE